MMLPVYLNEGQIAVTETRFLNDLYDLRVRIADKAGSNWECCGDIINRLNGKPVGRVYGRARNQAAAEQEVELEAGRWLRRTGMAR